MARDRPRRGAGLAARLKASINARQEKDRANLRAEEDLRAVAQTERSAVLEDLAEFGRALGTVKVRQRKDSLELRLGEATLRFEAIGDAAEVRVSGDSLRGEHLLDWEPRLSRWVLVRRPRLGREQRELLFDAGLSRLMKVSFGLLVLDDVPAEVEVELEPETEKPPSPDDEGGFAGKRTL